MVRSWKQGFSAVCALVAGCLPVIGAAGAAGSDNVPGASAAASDTTLIRDASGMTAGGILSGVAGGGAFGGSNGASIPGRTLGAPGADGQQRFAIWADGGYQHTKFDNALLPYDGNTEAGAIGFDYRIAKGIFVGVAGGYENWDINTSFDAGTLKTNGYTVAPYALVALGNYVTLSGTGGYAGLSNDETRSNGAIRGSFDSKRYFGATALNGNYRGGNWLFNGSFTYIYTDQKDDAYADTGAAGAGAVGQNTAKIAQGRLGFKIGYDISGFAPYVVARIEHEFTAPAERSVGGTAVVNDATGYVLGGGLSFTRGALSAGLEGDSVERRANLTVYQLLGNLRFQF